MAEQRILPGTPRQQTQRSIFSYLSGTGSGPRAAAARDAGPGEDAGGQQLAHAGDGERAQRGNAGGAQKRNTNKRQTKGTKKKPTTLLDEESIDETDNEVEEEVQANSDDADFISDTERDATGMEQRRLDAMERDEDSGNEFEQYHDAIAHASGGKKRRKFPGDDAEEPFKKKERSKQRDLQVLNERGRGDLRRMVSEYPDKAPFFLPCGNFVTPWDKQPERGILDFGNDRGRLAEGAFRSDAHARWLNSDEQQMNFAEMFSVPVNETYQLKSVSTDVPNTPLDPRRCLSNATSKVLQCIRTMHEQTELDLMEGKHYEKVFLGLQRTSRELRQAMDGGPNGGLQGCAVDVLWRITSGEEVSNVSESTLRLLDILTMAKQGSKGDELFHMTTTDRVEWFTKGKIGLTKVQCGVQTKRAYNFQEASKKGAYCAVQDVDHRLLRRLWTHRYSNGGKLDFDEVKGNWVALSALVHGRHQVNNPEQMGLEIKHEDQLSTDLNTLQIFLYKDVLPAWDAVQKQTTTVSIEGIYLMATSPANDPLVFLRSIAENNPAASTLLSESFKHMKSVLGQETCTWDQLFSTDRAGAADVTPESRMVEGFFRFCHAKSLFNVQLGGMRMDLKDKKEMEVWKNYIEPVTEARKAHYRLLIKETLHDRANWREAHLPVLNNAMWLDFYHGHTYWKMSNQHVDQEIDEYVALWVNDDDEQEVRARLKDWQRSHFQSRDGSCMYVPEGEGWARNSGLWIKIRTDNSKSHDEEKQEAGKSKKNEDTFPRWAQPQQTCRMVKLWLSNAKDRAAGQDPLDVVLNNSKWIPDVEWLKQVMPTLEEQHEGIQWLFEMIGDYALALTAPKILGNPNPRMHDILHLVGKERNQIHKSVATVHETCRLSVLFRTCMQKINTSVKNALVQMQGTELLQWKLAALSINDLKKQNMFRDKWSEAHKQVDELQQNMQSSEDWKDLLCLSTVPSVFFNQSMARLDADLCYMNQLFMWIFICCTMAHNENRRGAYGMTMRVIDMAGTVDILKEGDGKMLNKTQVVKVTEKSPGAGADTTISFVMQMFVSSLTHISQTQEVKELASTARDTMHKQVSKMMYALFQGSGILMNSKGDFLNLLFQKELSNNGHMTELFKNEEDQLAWVESLMAHSGDVQVGAESGVAQAAWSTTMQLDHCHVERLKPIPVIVLTGNRPAQATPASAVEGGRWMHIASSTQDKDNGFFVVLKKEEMQGVFTPSLPTRVVLARIPNQEPCTQRRVAKKSSRARLSIQMSTDDVRKDIKIITREDVQNNMLHFLLMQWLRKDAALLLSTLTHEAYNYCYSMKCTFSRVECAVGQLAKGLRRDFLDTNAQYWHRNAMGPWAKVMQVSMHVYFTMCTALLAGIDRTRDGWPLDLHLSFVLGIRSLMTNTISFMALLSSMHLWLASAVLDYNFMILSCYMYHFTCFQHTCSLRILSLVLAGHELNEEDFGKYLKFCEHIAPCVLEKSVLAERTDFGPRNVISGVLQAPSHTVLADWYSWHVQALQNEIRTAHAARTQGPAQEKFSVYCQPRMSFLHKESIKGFGRPKDGHQTAPDFNISGSSSRVLATSIGMAQKPLEHQKRLDKGPCIDGRVAAPARMQPWEDTVEFWKKVRKGTLLPEASTATNDTYKIKFEYVPYTGLWWDTTVQNAAHCDGIVNNFLLQSDLDDDICHFEFFSKLLRPYLQHKQSRERVYGGPQAPGVHKNAWKVPVLDKLKPFEFSSLPHIDAQHQPQGVNVNICMSLVHYVLVQGLGVTKDWNRAAHHNAAFVSCVHLRNTSHMTLGLLSMLLHTCCEKAMIPANNGQLRLPLPSPDFNSQTEALVEYDSRLHVDTSLHLMGGISDNVLSVDARLAKSENWRLVILQEGCSALVYASVLGEGAQIPSTTGQLFPFPPEAVAHNASFFKYMALAHKRFAEQVEKEPELGLANTENLFALAMLKLGASIRFEEYQHVQPSLTDCVVRDAREIPCVTCEHGFLFTICFEDGVLNLRPVAPTLSWDAVSDISNDAFKPFEALPASAASLRACDFAKLFRHGLKAQQTTDGLQVAVDIGYSEEKRLPFYLFPVMHFPVLVVLRQNGWIMAMPEVFEDNKNDTLFLHGAEHFYATDCRACHMRRVDEELAWFQEHCPELVQVLQNLQPESLSGLSELEAYFFSKDTEHIFGLWAKYKGVRVHFDSLHQFQAHVLKGVDVDLLVPVCEALYQQEDKNTSDYYMMEHELWGYAPVRFAQTPESEQIIATFTWLHGNAEDSSDLPVSKEDSKVEAQQLIEQVRKVEFTFKEFMPNMIPRSKDSEKNGACWGLTVENDGAFLRGGSYTLSAVGNHPRAGLCSSTQHMDFITMSRCMVPEGSELWIGLTAQVYACILEQAQAQGPSLMLPVSHHLHASMPEHNSRYLRAFYTLGGSLHDQPIDNNQVRVICVIATKNCMPGKKATADDHATADSRVNQNISAENTRFVAISLPVLVDGAPVLHHSRDPALPFYKYLKENAAARQRRD